MGSSDEALGIWTTHRFRVRENFVGFCRKGEHEPGLSRFVGVGVIFLGDPKVGQLNVLLTRSPVKNEIGLHAI